MTHLLSLSLLLACCAYPLGPGGEAQADGQGVSPRPPGSPSVVAPRLELQEVERTYCGGDQLRLRLKLKFTNVGGRPLIIYKLAGPIFQEMVSKSERAAAASRYEKVSHNLPMTFRDFQIPVESTPGDLYVVLQPGESHEVTRQGIIFLGGRRKDKSHQLKPGAYFYQVKVSTWTDSPTLANQLREHWKKIGDFWTSDVTSRPMPLSIHAHQTDAPCSN